MNKKYKIKLFEDLHKKQRLRKHLNNNYVDFSLTQKKTWERLDHKKSKSLFATDEILKSF